MLPVIVDAFLGRPLPLAFTLGGPEIAVVAGIILLLFGAQRVPGLMKSLARGAATVKHEHDELMGDVSNVKNALTREVTDLTRDVSVGVVDDDTDGERC